MSKTFWVVLAGSVLLVNSCNKSQEKNELSSVEHAAPRAVEALDITPRPLKRVVQTSSTVRGVHEVTVVSQTSGIVQRSALRLGQFVQRGAVLVEVESQVQAAAVEQAKAAYESAALNLDVIQKLHMQNGVSNAELSAARTQYTSAMTGVKQTQSALDNTRITAPISGFIASKEHAVQRGNVVNPGTVVARIVNLSSLTATIAVSESEMKLIENGMDVNVGVPAIGDTLFRGKVTGIGAGSFASTGSFPVEVTFKNTADHKVKSGMAANVSIESSTVENSIIIPVGAITERERKPAVYTSVNGRAVLNFVNTGRVVEESIEIKDGLREGQILVLTGIANISAGDSLSLTIIE